MTIRYKRGETYPIRTQPSLGKISFVPKIWQNPNEATRTLLLWACDLASLLSAFKSFDSKK